MQTALNNERNCVEFRALVWNGIYLRAAVFDALLLFGIPCRVYVKVNSCLKRMYVTYFIE